MSIWSNYTLASRQVFVLFVVPLFLQLVLLGLFFKFSAREPTLKIRATLFQPGQMRIETALSSLSARNAVYHHTKHASFTDVSADYAAHACGKFEGIRAKYATRLHTFRYANCVASFCESCFSR
jgi:hypothetical protein